MLCSCVYMDSMYINIFSHVVLHTTNIIKEKSYFSVVHEVVYQDNAFL